MTRSLAVYCPVRLDARSAPRLWASLQDTLAGDSPRVDLDLSAVELLDAYGVLLLLAVARRARERGGQLTLRHPSPALERTLRLSRLDRLARLSSPMRNSVAA